MGDTKRQFSKMYVDFAKRFKEPLGFIGKLMPIDFSDEKYLTCFRDLYPHLWNDIEKEYAFWKKKNEKVIQLGKKSRYNFPKPEKFILLKSIHIRSKYRKFHSNGTVLSQREQDELYQQLFEENQNKLNSQQQKQFKKLELTQEIEPKHIKTYINSYFEIQNLGQDSIDRKFEILREVAKYKSKETISFLQKVNAGEKNINLRNEAFSLLQQMGEKVILRRNAKGKKKETQTLKSMVEENPNTLIEKIYDDNLEQIKDFDIFLSHSSNDRNEVIQLYKKLNNSKFHIYIDWVNDRYALKRNLLSADTAKVIIQRLEKSKVLIYYHSEASLNSQWTPWEIGVFHGQGKNVYVYNPKNIELPCFLQVYPTLSIKGQDICVCEGGNKTKFKV